MNNLTKLLLKNVTISFWEELGWMAAGAATDRYISNRRARKNLANGYRTVIMEDEYGNLWEVQVQLMSLHLLNVVQNNPKEFMTLFAGIILADEVVDDDEIEYCYDLTKTMYDHNYSIEEFKNDINNFKEEEIENCCKVIIDNLDTDNEKSHDDIRLDYEFFIVALIILGLSDFEIDDKEMNFLIKVSSFFNISENKVKSLVSETIEASKTEKQ